jgi:hypothetical protein
MILIHNDICMIKLQQKFQTNPKQSFHQDAMRSTIYLAANGNTRLNLIKQYAVNPVMWEYNFENVDKMRAYIKTQGFCDISSQCQRHQIDI